MDFFKADDGKGGTKGIIFAADSGAQLYPTTQVTAKGLIPVYDKPMIYYPLCTLMLAGIREILIVSLPRHLRSFMELLGNGSRLGVNISYAEHPRGAGTGETFLTAERFIDPARDQGSGACLVLVDTILDGASNSLRDALPCEKGATVFASQAKSPNRHARAEPDTIEDGLRLDEESRNVLSDYVATGLSVYDREVVEITRFLVESRQGELEIAEVNREYLQRGELRVRRLSHGIARLDASTESGLLEAASFVASFQKRRGLNIGCIEEAAFRMGFINAERLERVIHDLPENGYRKYLARLARALSDEKQKEPHKTLFDSSIPALGGVG
jgi:glucose-1-phosphate thymidylyltransferase